MSISTLRGKHYNKWELAWALPADRRMILWPWSNIEPCKRGRGWGKSLYWHISILENCNGKDLINPLINRLRRMIVFSCNYFISIEIALFL
jgi:hypothetical protein